MGDSAILKSMAVALVTILCLAGAGVAINKYNNISTSSIVSSSIVSSSEFSGEFACIEVTDTAIRNKYYMPPLNAVTPIDSFESLDDPDQYLKFEVGRNEITVKKGSGTLPSGVTKVAVRDPQGDFADIDLSGSSGTTVNYFGLSPSEVGLASLFSGDRKVMKFYVRDELEIVGSQFERAFESGDGSLISGATISDDKLDYQNFLEFLFGERGSSITLSTKYESPLVGEMINPSLIQTNIDGKIPSRYVVAEVSTNKSRQKFMDSFSQYFLNKDFRALSDAEKELMKDIADPIYKKFGSPAMSFIPVKSSNLSRDKASDDGRYIFSSAVRVRKN